ncbi:putative type VI secretion system effector [Acinetobacter indicus]|uniref:putative type VI secretion system effector n=1 Tax=Acinetobacter indicus TaxID=756892 RepID=UPI0012E126F7|nr:putative type VI secretion system effector [Acinetobacter indicus]
MYLYDLLKFEGRIEALEIHNGVLNTLGGAGDNLIKSSAILSTVAGSVSLGAQTVFLATQSRLHIQTVVMKIGGKVCVGQFHRALFEAGEYVICIARQIEPNVYELCSVLSPKTGLLHMQVGMGAADKPAYKSMMKGGRVWYAISIVAMFLLFIFTGGLTQEMFLILTIVSFISYFIFMFIVKNAFNSLRHLNEKSEQVFEMYGFQNPEKIYLLTARHQDDNAKLILESVYEYRRAVEYDPYPESYIKEKEGKIDTFI